MRQPPPPDGTGPPLPEFHPADEHPTGPGASSPPPGDEATDPEQVLDPTALKRLEASLGRSAPVVLPNLIDVYLEESEKYLVRAREALAEGDAEGLRRAIHTLKSESAMMGAMGLARLCQGLEDYVRGGTLVGVAESLGQVRAVHAGVRVALGNVRRGLGR